MGLTAWRGSEAFYQLWKFFRLNTQVVAKIKNCQVDKISASQFALTAFYTYPFQNRKWESHSQLPPPYFPNSYAAREMLMNTSFKEVEIWMDSSCPTYTAMQRDFPWRAILYAISSLAILFYFFYLKKYSRS